MQDFFSHLITFGTGGFVLVFGVLLLLYAFAQGRQLLSFKTVCINKLLPREAACLKGLVMPMNALLTSPLGKVDAVYWQVLIQTGHSKLRGGSSYALVDQKYLGDNFLIRDDSAEIPVRFGDPRDGVSVDLLQLSIDLCSYEDQRTMIQSFSYKKSEDYLKERSELRGLKFSKHNSLRLSEKSICEGQELFVWGSVEKNAEGKAFFKASLISDSGPWHQGLKSLVALLAGLFLIQMGLGLFKI